MDYSHTGKAVLDFYKTLPFNYYGTIEQQCDSVSQLKSLEHEYPCLEGLVSPSKNLLEIGCGTGWLTNSIAKHYKKRVLGLDFNPHAIERAQAVSNRMELKSEFLCDNLFHFSKNKKQQGAYFDLIISLGVLHHTDNCIEAIKAICKNLLATEGYFFVGLYHQYGRKPFLKYFENLKKSGHTEDELLKKYKELHPIKDETLLRSWFRDQVLHPHETLHTIEEIIDLLSELSCQLVATSINKFSNINNLQDLVEEEKIMGYLAKEKLIEKKYFPGFFVFLLKKK